MNPNSAHAATAFSYSACDPQILMEQLDGDAAAVLGLVDTFLETFPGLQARLLAAREAVEQGGEAAPLRRVVHELKGVCAIFTARAALDRAREIETLLAENGVEAGLEECLLWEPELALLQADIRAFRQDLASRT